MLGSSLVGQRLGFDSRWCSDLQCRAGPCLREGGGGFFVLAKQVSRKERTQKRHKTIRSKVEGRPDRPRLAVYRSNNHIYAQVIDDYVGHTLVAASTLTPEIRAKLNGSGGADKGAAQLVGQRIAELCLAKDINDVSFDRGGNVYHGRVKALADAARETGLSF